MVNLASPKTFKIIEYILERKEFTQYRASIDLKDVSFGLINRITNWLISKKFIARKNNKYILKDPAGLISATAIYRDMNSLKLFQANTSLNQKELIKLIPKKAIYCLDSALKQWTNYYKSNRVCIYLPEKEIQPIKKKLEFKPGNNSILCIYREHPKTREKTIKGKNYTTKIRTIIDLACDERIFTTETLFNEIWGKKLA